MLALTTVLELGRDGSRGSGGAGEEVEAELDAQLGKAVVDEVAVAVADGLSVKSPGKKSFKGEHTYFCSQSGHSVAVARPAAAARTTKDFMV